MDLPVIEQKWYKTKLVSNGAEIRYRNYTVGEQKQIMLSRTNTQNDFETYRAIIEMTQNCIKGYKIEDMYVSEFEKLFYDIRSVSDGNIINFKMKCKSCEAEDSYSVNTCTEFNIINEKNFEKTVLIDKEHNIAFKMRQPKIKDLLIIESKKYTSPEEKSMDTMVYCLDSILNGDSVLVVNKDFTHDEAVKWIDSLPQSYILLLRDFYEQSPSLNCIKEFECPACKAKSKISSVEIKSFLS